MTQGRRGGGHMARALAALAAGTALGASATGGTALLLYTGQGFIRAAGLLVASTIMAVAAGVWASAPDDGDGLSTPTRGRWVALVVAMILAGVLAALWGAWPTLRSLAAGGAVAVLLLLALPAYATGALLAGLHARDRARMARGAAGGVAPAAMAGAATGVLLATTVLILALDAHDIYYGAAAVLALVSMLDRGRGPRPIRGEDGMLDHVSIITGVGARGQLGYALARRFAEAGACVVVTGRRPEVIDLAAELSEFGQVIGVEADLLDERGVDQVVETARRAFGRIDSLINAAGGLTVAGRVADTTPEDWQREMDRNAGTALRMIRAALPALRESRGAIVNFASPAVEHPVAALGAYTAAKGAVLALTRALALEESASGVRVNAVSPGPMATEQNRALAAEDGQPAFIALEDVADAVLFLAAPAARGVSGETVGVRMAAARGVR